jgi:hypothetical protein
MIEIIYIIDNKNYSTLIGDYKISLAHAGTHLNISTKCVSIFNVMFDVSISHNHRIVLLLACVLRPVFTPCNHWPLCLIPVMMYMSPWWCCHRLASDIGGVIVIVVASSAVVRGFGSNAIPIIRITLLVDVLHSLCKQTSDQSDYKISLAHAGTHLNISTKCVSIFNVMFDVSSNYWCPCNN